MSTEELKLIGLEATDQERIGLHLERLLPYIDTDKFILAGGISTRFFLARHGLSLSSRQMNDLDAIALSRRAVNPKIISEGGFLVEHYHVNKNSPDKLFYFTLVDPQSRTKIDIFDPSMKPQQIISVTFQGHTILLQSPEDQLVTAVLENYRVFATNTVTEVKHIESIRLLLKIVPTAEVSELWKKRITNDLWKLRGYQGEPISFEEARDAFLKTAQSRPDLFQPELTKKDKREKCEDCIKNPQFPIAPMEKIKEILGYLE